MMSKPNNPYQEMDHRPGEDHPLDIVVRSQIPATLISDIRTATKHLQQALGAEVQPWLDLEGLLNDYRQQREEIVFNIGYENGFSNGCTETLLRLKYNSSNTFHIQLLKEIRKVLLPAECSLKSKIAVLLEIGLALILTSSQNPKP